MKALHSRLRYKAVAISRERMSNRYGICLSVLVQTGAASSQHSAYPPRCRAHFLYPGRSQVHRSQYGRGSFYENWFSAPVFHGALCRNRAATVPLLIVIATAIATTKAPELFRASQGFWYMGSDARADFAMLCSNLFLLCAGGGEWSLDSLRARKSIPGRIQ